ncbi:MAG: LPP20 family lipoprotein [Acidaminococcales bacterium]|jgi:hypothetical protein|nr:LPP20 family lipoprotein [Acidaminococcales bacterium]
MKKFFLFLFCAIAIAAGLPGQPALAQGQVDWVNKSVTATGFGAPNPKHTNPAQSRLMARSAAIADAYRALAETAQGVQVDGTTTAANKMAENDIVRTRVMAVLKGATIVSEGWDGEGAERAYMVTMQIPLFGASSLLEGLLSAEEVKPPVPFALPSAPVPETPPPTITTLQAPPAAAPAPSSPPPRAPAAAESAPPPAPPRQNAYSGVVVDCRGMGLVAVATPSLYDNGKRAIYTPAQVDVARQGNPGMLDYSQSLDSQERAGGNPLIVKAVTLDGNNANPVISSSDADYILAENAKSRFFDNLSVVFVTENA